MTHKDTAQAKPAETGRPYTVVEAAKLLRVNRNLVYEIVNRGELPSIRVGKRILLPRPAIDRILAEGNFKAA